MFAYDFKNKTQNSGDSVNVENVGWRGVGAAAALMHSERTHAHANASAPNVYALLAVHSAREAALANIAVRNVSAAIVCAEEAELCATLANATALLAPIAVLGSPATASAVRISHLAIRHTTVCVEQLALLRSGVRLSGGLLIVNVSLAASAAQEIRSGEVVLDRIEISDHLFALHASNISRQVFDFLFFFFCLRRPQSNVLILKAHSSWRIWRRLACFAR